MTREIPVSRTQVALGGCKLRVSRDDTKPWPFELYAEADSEGQVHIRMSCAGAEQLRDALTALLKEEG